MFHNKTAADSSAVLLFQQVSAAFILSPWTYSVLIFWCFLRLTFSNWSQKVRGYCVPVISALDHQTPDPLWVCFQCVSPDVISRGQHRAVLMFECSNTEADQSSSWTNSFIFVGLTLNMLKHWLLFWRRHRKENFLCKVSFIVINNICVS